MPVFDWTGALSQRRILFAWFTAAFLLVLPRAAEAERTRHVETQEGVRVITEVSEQVVRTAEPFDVRIEIVAPADSTCELPDSLPSSGTFEVLDFDIEANLPMQSGERRSFVHLQLESILPGAYSIPAIDFSLQLANSSLPPIALQSHPVSVQVASVLGEADVPDQFRGIELAVDIPIEDSAPASALSQTVVITAMVATGSLMLVATMVLVRKRYRRSWSPQTWAEARVNELGLPDTEEAVEVREWVLSLDRIVKECLAMQLGFQSLSLSSDQIAETLDANSSDNELAQEFQGFVELTDRVKFAGESLPVSSRELRNQAVRIVALTEIMHSLPQSPQEAR